MSAYFNFDDLRNIKTKEAVNSSINNKKARAPKTTSPPSAYFNATRRPSIYAAANPSFQRGSVRTVSTATSGSSGTTSTVESMSSAGTDVTKSSELSRRSSLSSKIGLSISRSLRRTSTMIKKERVGSTLEAPRELLQTEECQDEGIKKMRFVTMRPQSEIRLPTFEHVRHDQQLAQNSLRDEDGNEETHTENKDVNLARADVTRSPLAALEQNEVNKTKKQKRWSKMLPWKSGGS